MNNETIKRINTIGKAANVLTIIGRVMSIIAVVACIIAGIILLAIPMDSIKFSGGGNLNFEYSVDKELPVKVFDFDDMSTMIKEQNIKIGGIEVDITKADLNETYGSFEGSLNMNNIDMTHIMRLMSMGMFFAAIYAAIILVIMIFGQKLAKAFAVCTSPFEENVIKRMKAFAYSLIPLGIISLFTGSGFKMSDFANLTGIHININFSAIILILAVFLFVQIFNYGAQLQRESDETL